MVLEGISKYLTYLPNGFKSMNLPPVVSFNLNQTTNVSVISIQNIDALYDYLAYFLMSMPFQTRKSIDFMY
jgi:hypothetical protein